VNKVLIIQTAFLGDVILATPVVSELARLYPDLEIDMLVKKGNESLLANNPYIRTVFTFDKKQGKWRNMRSLIRTFRKEKYDLVINLQRYMSSGIITALSGAKTKYGFKKNPMSRFFSKRFPHHIGKGTHEVERNLSLIKSYGSKSLIRPQLYPGQEEFDRILEYGLTPYYTIAPASVWHTKQLPEHKWIELINSLPSDFPIYILGGKEDSSLADRLKNEFKDRSVINMCGALSLLESAALMSKAKRNYVNDSGPLHLASGMNAPVTAFFCSTIPDFGFGPLSDDSSISQVEDLACRPCGLHGHKECPQGHFKCGNEIKFN